MEDPNASTRRFKISDRLIRQKSLEEIVDISPFVEEYGDISRQNDAVKAQVLTEIVRKCPKIKNRFEDLCKVLSRITCTNVRINVNIRNEYMYTYNTGKSSDSSEGDGSQRTVYTVPLPSCPADFDFQGSDVRLLFEDHPANLLKGNKLSLLLAGWGDIKTLAYDALIYESKVLDGQQDPLTGLLNRRGIELLLKFHLGALERETNKAEKEGREINADYEFALVAVDIDNFKRINDKYGHQKGDAVLKTVAEYLTTVAKRDIDDVARDGGEEFLILLSGGNYEGISEAVETLRRDIYNQKYKNDFGELPEIPKHSGDPDDFDCHFSVSMGIVHTSELRSLKGAKRVLKRLADTRLYYAKENGRNMVVSKLTKNI